MTIYANTPTPKILDSLRSSGYHSVSAVNDIVDNSIDAGATKINVMVSNESIKESKTKIEDSFHVRIADNGCGMNEDTLVEALKLGSETPHEKDDLGKFGMGLITASISFARQIEVMTRTKDGEYLKGTFDFDHIINNRDWTVTVEKMIPGEVLRFTGLCGQHGTIVTLRNIDRCSYSNINSYKNAIIKDIGLSYAELLGEKIEIQVHPKKVNRVDVLEPQMKDHQMQDDLIIDMGESSVSASYVMLSKEIPMGKAGKDMCNVEVTLKTSGIYFYRCGRLIANKSFKIIGRTPHNSQNRLRFVVRFDESMDELMGIDFTKSDINPTQAVIDKMKEAFGTICASASRMYKERSTKENADATNEAVKKAQDKVSNQSKFLKFPPKSKEKRGPYKKSDKPRKPHQGGKRTVKGRNFEVRYVKNNPMDRLVVFDVENGEIVITWNTRHPFYGKYMLVKEDGYDHNTIMEAFQYIAFSIASSMFTGVTEDVSQVHNEEFELIIHHLVSNMSDTLRYISMDKSK